MKIAFAGFRHGHIMSLYEMARRHEGVEVVAASEEDAATREQMTAQGEVQITHDSHARMLREVPCDAVAVGDYYGRRGEIVIAALAAGKHVIADKPLCTRLSELEQIERLARSKRLAVGCQLDLRCSGILGTLRQVVRDGAIGEVHTVTFTGQHPLLHGKRAGWYFEPGKHGGTINDIAIHGLDALGWLTGRKVAGVVAARAWNARLPAVSHFQDAAQFMLKLDNGGGVLADVSYLAPDGCGYAMPQYWRFTLHGDGGMAETSLNSDCVLLARASDSGLQRIAPQPRQDDSYFAAFLAQCQGRGGELLLTTEEVLASSRLALEVQAFADGHPTGA